MAILFSKATLSSGEKQTSFLVSGVPSTAAAFKGWTGYRTFVDSLAPASHVMADITAYTYGGEDIVEASPEEVTYMTMRLKGRPDFLEKRCEQQSRTRFEFEA